MYRKELSLVLSRSYGPGRYDPEYEEDGVDYPVGYVRWTEKRNMEAFLDLLSSGAIDVTLLTSRRCPFEQASGAYQELKDTGAYTALLEYPERALITMPAPRAEPRRSPQARRAHSLNIGCIGAGSFARDTIFPALRKSRGVALHSVATASGVASESARRLFNFSRALPPAELLQDKETDAAFVLSRHDSHAQYVIAGLSNHKPVFVEKPLAVSREQLEEIRGAYQAERAAGQVPFLMVGFNRRFAPFTEKLKQFFAGRRESMVINIRVNAGYIAADHWVQRGQSGGGRIIGELCHFVDWARCIGGYPMVNVTANALPDGARYNRDNVVAAITFEDGSIANLVYLANGDRSIAKEQFEVFCEGRWGESPTFPRLSWLGRER
jgi:polar amino acid transport system substrate-binding protein